MFEEFLMNLFMNINDIKDVFNSYNENAFTINEINYRKVLSGEIENSKIDIAWNSSRTEKVLEIKVNLHNNNIIFKELKISNINITNINKVYSSKNVYEHSKPIYAWCKDKEYANKILNEGIIEMLIKFFDATKLKWKVVLENNLIKIKIHYAFFKIMKKDFYNNLYDFLKNLIKKVNDDKFYPSNLGKNVEEIQKENFDKKVRSNLRAKVIIIVFTVIIILQLFKLLAGLFNY